MSVNRILAETMVETSGDKTTQEKKYIPLRELVRIVSDEDLKEITAGRNGEYIPVNFYQVADVPAAIEGVRKAVDEDSHWDVSFGGTSFRTRR